MEPTCPLAIGRRTRQSILKGKRIRKLKDGGDLFEDYFTDSDGESSTMSVVSDHARKLPESSPNADSPKKALKVSDYINSSSCQKINHSPLKSREAVSNDPVMPDDDSVNQETSTADCENVTLNLGDNDPEPEAFDAILEKDRISLSSNTYPAVIEEIRGNENCPLSETYDKKSETPKIIFKASRKSISKATKKDAKKGIESRYDEYDEKIMQMIHIRNDEIVKHTTDSEEEMVSIEEPSLVMETRESAKAIKMQVEKSFTNTSEEENLSHKKSQSPNKIIRKNTKSFIESNNDLESASFINVHVNKTASISKYKKGKQNVNYKRNSFTHLKSTEKKTYPSRIPRLKKNSSKTFISKQHFSAKNGYAVNTSQNSDKDMPYSDPEADSESEINTHEDETKQQDRSCSDSELDVVEDISAMGDNTAQEHLVNNEKSAIDKRSFLSNETTFESDDIDDLSMLTSKRRRTSVNKRNGSMQEGNDANTSINSENSVKNISKTNANKSFEKQKKNKHDESRQKKTRKKSYFRPVDSDNVSEPQTSDRQKTRNGYVSERDDHSIVSMRSSSKKSVNSVSNTSKKQKENIQYIATNKRSSFIPDENDHETDGYDNLPEQQTSKRQKSISARKNPVPKGNDLVNTMSTSKDSINKISEVSIKNTSKKLKVSQNIKNKERTTLNKRSNFILEENDLDDCDNLPEQQTSKRQKAMSTRKNPVLEENDTSLNSSEDFAAVSEVNIKKNSKKQRKIENNQSRQKTTSKRSSLQSVENILETTQYDDLVQLRTSNRQKTRHTKENDLVNMSMNTSDDSLGNVPEVVKKTTKNERKVEKKKHLHDDYEEQHSSKKEKSTKPGSVKNKMHKEHESDQPVRVSTRQKYAPLASWRNERIIYRYESGQIITVSHEKGTKEDAAALRQLYNAVYKRQIRKNNKIVKPKKAKILDVKEKKEKLVHLHAKFPLVSWESPVNHPEYEKHPEQGFLIKRMISTVRNAFGYLQIGVGKTKPPQFMPEEDLQLCVLTGKVEINVNKNVYILESKDMFVVPRGSAYSITNIGKRKALLSYVVGKFKYID